MPNARKLFISLVLIIIPFSPAHAENIYLPYTYFSAWQELVPELSEPRLCGTTKAGMNLWREGQMRIPVEGSVSKILNIHLFSEEMNGGAMWAVALTDGDDAQSCRYVFLARNSGNHWQRILLQQAEPENDRSEFDLVWNSQSAAIGIDFDRRTRLTHPATMTWSPDGHRSSEAGYVIEKRLISQVIRWNDKQAQFQYVRLEKPELWDTE